MGMASMICGEIAGQARNDRWEWLINDLFLLNKSRSPLTSPFWALR
jgi:hypothetical protein